MRFKFNIHCGNRVGSKESTGAGSDTSEKASVLSWGAQGTEFSYQYPINKNKDLERGSGGVREEGG